ncbi:unnamed protein product [Notodromas monacha]|uniref:LIM zinc-binding domain-containing protein n=1 Tax=Notodromas monacha TaxID=399045 RepID=A0A7R9GHD6_9CRUS|nr:unnamed protein product [Notodromas monacha]CAG0921210.1 unnamed protein product [Notodromas monacha]
MYSNHIMSSNVHSSRRAAVVPEAAPIVSVVSDDPRCPRCGHRVYHAERMIIGGNTYHKTCFTCRVCKVHLDSLNSNERDSQLYCKKCYGRAFGPRGYGFGMGAGTLSMTMTALLDSNCNTVVHNPATQHLMEHSGASNWEAEEVQRRENKLSNYRYVKTNAHDNLITPNVPAVAQAHAYPRLLEERQATQTRYRQTAARLPPNVVSLIPASAAGSHRHEHHVNAYKNDPEAFIVPANRQ